MSDDIETVRQSLEFEEYQSGLEALDRIVARIADLEDRLRKCEADDD